MIFLKVGINAFIAYTPHTATALANISHKTKKLHSIVAVNRKKYVILYSDNQYNNAY